MSNRKKRNRFNLNLKAGVNKLRLCVFRSCKHVSAQVIDRNGNVLADVSSSEKNSPAYSLVKTEKARWVGNEIAKKVNLSIDEFYFDRGKYAYHGVVKVLAETAREAGMRF